MKNKLSDLNNLLFAQMERLSDEELSDEALMKEIARTKALSLMAVGIIGNGRLMLEAVKVKDMSPDIEYIPILLE